MRSFFIRSMLESTPNRVAAKTRNWAMVIKMLWSTSPCGGSNIAQIAMMLATIRATADKISFTDHIFIFSFLHSFISRSDYACSRLPYTFASGMSAPEFMVY